MCHACCTVNGCPRQNHITLPCATMAPAIRFGRSLLLVAAARRLPPSCWYLWALGSVCGLPACKGPQCIQASWTSLIPYSGVAHTHHWLLGCILGYARFDCMLPTAQCAANHICRVYRSRLAARMRCTICEAWQWYACHTTGWLPGCKLSQHGPCLRVIWFHTADRYIDTAISV